jgi:hypothetical protein
MRAHRHALLIAALAAAVLAVAAPQTSALDGSFRIARLKYGGGGDWYSNPSSLPNLMKGR